MTAEGKRWVPVLARFGLAARGVVFLINGGFLLLAALQHDPSEARGLAGVLRALQGQPHGMLLLAVVALGLMAFGAYSLVEARYRRIQVPSELR